MTPETVLETRLQDDITWRIRELSEIVRACSECEGTRQHALLRASVPVIYAHWEGYFVFATNAYLNFVADKRLPLRDLKDEFWSLTIRKRYRAQQMTGSVQFNRFLLEIRRDSLNDRTFKKGAFERVSGSSNLRSEVLLFCCSCLGLSSSSFSPYLEFIDKELVETRNHIAHGSSLRFANSSVSVYRDKVVELMRVTKTEIENSVARELYKRAIDFVATPAPPA